VCVHISKCVRALVYVWVFEWQWEWNAIYIVQYLRAKKTKTKKWRMTFSRVFFLLVVLCKFLCIIYISNDLLFCCTLQFLVPFLICASSLISLGCCDAVLGSFRLRFFQLILNWKFGGIWNCISMYFRYWIEVSFLIVSACCFNYLDFHFQFSITISITITIKIAITILICCQFEAGLWCEQIVCLFVSLFLLCTFN